jgi:putative membrane protein
MHHFEMHHFEHHWHPMDYGNGVGGGVGGWPGMLLSTLSTLFWAALFIWLVWVLLVWVLPYIFPLFAGPSSEMSAEPAALEILRQRYAAGEIDGVTFEQMRERLNASYQAEHNEFPPDDGSYIRET